jgi:predicted outer membrane lipoprotein
MTKEMDAALYAAALYVITDMWADTMDTMQRASLANQIVREIERRNILSDYKAHVELNTVLDQVARTQSETPN